MATLSFQGGTLVLYEVDQSARVPEVFQWIKGRWRCEAYHYAHLRLWLKQAHVRDQVPRWQTLALTIHDPRQPHTYQREALTAWKRADQRGSIVLPTGAGKTFVAIQAIAQVARSTLIIAPTIDLLHQWYSRLSHAFDTAIGVYYGGEKLIHPITVTTYHSAGDLIADMGDQFRLIIYDEVHHLPAPQWGETALMSPAPSRLGLTATYPEASDGRWPIEQLIGPIVYSQRIEDLVGKQLANYRTERLRVNLTHDERAVYERDYAVYADFFRSRQLQKTHGRDWLKELMRLSSFEREARRAWLARQRLQRLLSSCAAKLDLLDQLLREYIDEQVLIFTELNETAYLISERYLIPALTHHTKAAERKTILARFQERQYRAIVTSRVLNEGVDVPEAKIAIVLGGTSAAREYIQRLGRVLRKVGNRHAVLFEVIVRDTLDEGKAQRRRPRSTSGKSDVNG
jgi:superfamily II DNA or RNA helicase